MVAPDVRVVRAGMDKVQVLRRAAVVALAELAAELAELAVAVLVLPVAEVAVQVRLVAPLEKVALVEEERVNVSRNLERFDEKKSITYAHPR
jgi:hypothetical protein